MPRESADRRKSSIGSRRGPPKKHIPFRADDLRLGKKTGIAVQYVGRDSDEFEPFDELMKQADDRTPPRVKSRKKKVSVATALPLPDDEYDENGEMSMELAESNQGSPLAYFTNAPKMAPNSARKLGSSRSVPRTSDIDFDEVPSPRMRSAPSRRASAVNGAGPSALSKSFSVYNDTPGQDPAPDPDFEPANQDFDYEPPENDTPSQAGVSFNHANYEDEEENDAAEVEEEVASRAKSVNKGKQRAVVEAEQQEEDGIEDDIAQRLEEVENAPDEEEEVEEDPPPKKFRKDNQKEQKPKKPRARAPKRAITMTEENSPPPDGVRRSRRYRYKPLEYWRQEKVVYGRPESGHTLVPQIKEIIRIPQEPPKPLGKAAKKRKRSGSERAKSSNPQPYDPEQGWDDDTQEIGIVIDYATQEPVSRRIVYTANKVDPKAAAGGAWFFQKVFGEGDFIAAGVLRIPPNGRKPSKGTKDNTYVFYVIEGAVVAVVHETQYIVATGGMFIVPRGNTYYIENISERDAKIFFTQARQVIPGDEPPLDHASHSAPPSSHPQRASGSAAPPPLAKRGTSMRV